MSDAATTDDADVCEDRAAGAAGLVLSAFLPYRIAVLGRRMSEALARAYDGEGLSIPEWRVLAVVSQKARMAARDVVALTPMDKMAVSRAVAALEAKRLIERSISADDRRVAVLSLTRAGRVVYGRVADIARDYEAALLGALSAEDRRHFDRLLARLEDATGGDVG